MKRFAVVMALVGFGLGLAIAVPQLSANVNVETEGIEIAQIADPPARYTCQSWVCQYRTDPDDNDTVVKVDVRQCAPGTFWEKCSTTYGPKCAVVCTGSSGH